MSVSFILKAFTLAKKNEFAEINIPGFDYRVEDTTLSRLSWQASLYGQLSGR